MSEEMREEESGGEKPSFSGDLFDQVAGRINTPMSEGGGPRQLPRRRITFVVDHTLCRPGTFPEDFKITLVGLTPGQEIKAAQMSGGDAVAMGYTMAMLSIQALNGRALSLGKGERDQVWEWLATPGRNLVASMFGEYAAPGAAAVGKARATLSFG